MNSDTCISASRCEMQQSWTGFHVWCNCPFHQLGKFLTHSVKKHLSHPSTPQLHLLRLTGLQHRGGHSLLSILSKSFTSRDNDFSLQRLNNSAFLVRANDLHADSDIDSVLKHAEPPLTYPEAISRKDGPQWEKCTKKEMQTLAKNGSCC